MVAAPITPLDLLCATGTSLLRHAGTAVRAGCAGRRAPCGRVAGLVPHLGGHAPRATAAWPRRWWCPASTSCRCRTGATAGDGRGARAVRGGGALRADLARRAGARRAGRGARRRWRGRAGGRAAGAAGRRRQVVAAARSSAGAQPGRSRWAPGCRPAAARRRRRRSSPSGSRAAAGGSVDLVLDPLFGVPAAAALRVLRPGGRLVNLGGAAGGDRPLDSATLRSGSLRVLGYTNNELPVAQRAESLGVVAGHAAQGRLTVAHETVPLEDVAERVGAGRPRAPRAAGSCSPSTVSRGLVAHGPSRAASPPRRPAPPGR